MPKSFIEQAMDAIFATHGKSPTHRAIFREVYGADFPEEAEPLSYVAWPELRRVARELAVGPADTFADFGCGRGGPGLWVARATGATLVGMDLSEQAVAEARDRAAAFVPEKRARFEIADLAAVPFADATFSAGMSIAVIWMVPEPERALAEMARVLRPGGRLVFTSWDRTLSPPAAPPPIADHRPLLERAGFDAMTYDVVPHAEERRRRIYELYVERHDALVREMGTFAARALRFEAERALGVLDGTDYIAASRQVFVVARRRTPRVDAR